MTIHAHAGPSLPPAPTPLSPSPTTLLPPGDVVALRERCDGWTAARQRGFIEVLADTGSVATAAAAVDMTEQSAHRLRRRADAGAFAAAWEAALETCAVDLMDTAFARATTGVARARYFRGEQIGEERVPSDRLLIWLIEKGRAQLGRAQERKAVARDWDSALEALGEAGAPVGGYRIWMSPHGYPVTNLPPGDDLDDELWHDGCPGTPDYARSLTEAEEDAWRAENGFGGAEHAARTRLFPRLDPEDDGDENENDLRSG